MNTFIQIIKDTIHHAFHLASLLFESCLHVSFNKQATSLSIKTPYLKRGFRSNYRQYYILLNLQNSAFQYFLTGVNMVTRRVLANAFFQSTFLKNKNLISHGQKAYSTSIN